MDKATGREWNKLQGAEGGNMGNIILTVFEISQAERSTGHEMSF